MEKQVYRFAGHTVEINSLHSMVHEMCSEYRTEDEAELFVSICQSDIEEERERSKKRGLNGEGRNQQRRDAYLETLAVYRKLAESLLEYGVLLFHGSSVAVDGFGYIFAAQSGTGKSTHARLWRELLGGQSWLMTIKYDAPREVFERDVTEVLIQLRSIGVIED